MRVSTLIILLVVKIVNCAYIRSEPDDLKKPDSDKMVLQDSTNALKPAMEKIERLENDLFVSILRTIPPMSNTGPPTRHRIQKRCFGIMCGSCSRCGRDVIRSDLKQAQDSVAKIKSYIQSLLPYIAKIQAFEWKLDDCIAKHPITTTTPITTSTTKSTTESTTESTTASTTITTTESTTKSPDTTTSPHPKNKKPKRPVYEDYDDEEYDDNGYCEYCDRRPKRPPKRRPTKRPRPPVYNDYGPDEDYRDCNCHSQATKKRPNGQGKKRRPGGRVDYDYGTHGDNDYCSCDQTRSKPRKPRPSRYEHNSMNHYEDEGY